MRKRKRRSVLQSAERADGNGMRRPPGHLITGAGREVLRKGGGEAARSVRCICDVCAAHGDRAAVGVDVDAQVKGHSCVIASIHGSSARNMGLLAHLLLPVLMASYNMLSIRQIELAPCLAA